MVCRKRSESSNAGFVSRRTSLCDWEIVYDGRAASRGAAPLQSLREAAEFPHIGQQYVHRAIVSGTEMPRGCRSDLRPHVRSIAQAYSSRSEQEAYVGHVFNIEQKVASWYDAAPSRPRASRRFPLGPLLGRIGGE